MRNKRRRSTTSQSRRSTTYSIADCLIAPMFISTITRPKKPTEPVFRVHQPTARGPLKRDRADTLHLQSLPNPKPNLACPARTPFLGEAVEGHPNRLDTEV